LDVALSENSLYPPNLILNLYFPHFYEILRGFITVFSQFVYGYGLEGKPRSVSGQALRFQVTGILPTKRCRLVYLLFGALFHGKSLGQLVLIPWENLGKLDENWMIWYPK